MTDDRMGTCSLPPRTTQLPPQTRFEEKLLGLLIVERARTRYYEELIAAGGPLVRFEYAESAVRDRYYTDSRVYHHAVL